MQYTLVYRKVGKVLTHKVKLNKGDLAETLADQKDNILSQLGADKNSPLFAIVK